MKNEQGESVIAFIRINTKQYPELANKVIRLKAEKRLNVEFRKFLKNLKGQQELAL